MMRRTFAAAALAVGLATVAACSGDEEPGDDVAVADGSVETVCERLRLTVEPLDADFNAALHSTGMAAAVDDEEEYEAAKAALDEVVGEIAEALRSGADATDEDEFAEALGDLADAVEGLADAAAEGERPAGTDFDEAGARVAEYCDEFAPGAEDTGEADPAEEDAVGEDDGVEEDDADGE